MLDVRCNRFQSLEISMYVREHSNLHRTTTLAEVMILDKLERLTQTHSVQIMCEHRISVEGQSFLQLLDPLRSLLQSRQMAGGILLPKLTI